MSADKPSVFSVKRESDGQSSEARSEPRKSSGSKPAESHGRRLFLQQHDAERGLSQQSDVSDARASYLSPNLTEFVAENHMADNMCFRQRSSMRSPAQNILNHRKSEVEKILTNLKSFGFYHKIKKVIRDLGSKEFEYTRSSNKVRANVSELEDWNLASRSSIKDPFAGQFSRGLENLSDRALYDMCTKTKSISYEIQTFIQDCQEAWIPILARRMFNWIANLLVDPFGNYVVQKLLVRSEEIQQATIQICLQNLKGYAQNEFSSRVMQTLAESDAYFRKQIIACASRHFVEFSKSISATLLVCACVRATGGSPDLEQLTGVILHHFAQPIDPTGYLLRHVVALVRVSPLRALVKIFQVLKRQCHQDSVMRCKKRLMVLVALLNRNFEPAMEYLNYILDQFGIWSTVNSKYFTYLAKKLERPDDQIYDGTPVAWIFRRILSSQTVLNLLSQDLGSSNKPSHQTMYLCYLVGILGPSDFNTVLVESRAHPTSGVAGYDLSF